MTLAQLRDLLALAHGPAIERLTTTVDPAFGVTPRAIAWHYLTRHITLHGDTASWFLPDLMDYLNEQGGKRLDLTDPGTVNAVKVALALGLGLDPGPLGISVSWTREWWSGWWTCWGAFGTPAMGEFTHRTAPTVAAEPDPIRALILAVEHVLSTP